MDTPLQKMSSQGRFFIFVAGMILVPVLVLLVFYFSEFDKCNFAHVDDTNVDKFIDCELRTSFRVCKKRYGAESLLHIASRFYASPDQIQKIIDAGCEVDARLEFSRHTPLHSAAFNADIGIVEVLVRNGADITAQNSTGRTPYDLFRTTVMKRSLSDEEIKQMRALLKYENFSDASGGVIE